MENMSRMVVPVILKGANYLLWSRTLKTALCSRGLGKHIMEDASTKPTAKPNEEGSGQAISKEEASWFQEDQMVLSILQSSLETSLLEAYSYCDTSKELWDTLKNVYGNTSNLLRIFEVKKAINDLSQEDSEFTDHFGRFRSLWAELEMLRPTSIDPVVLNGRREEDKVFGLLMTLNPVFNDLIKHILRSDKLPTLEEVCSQVQKEQGAHGLFEEKEGLHMANKASFKPVERKGLKCEHCKKEGHTKERCWILNPHLKPSKFR